MRKIKPTTQIPVLFLKRIGQRLRNGEVNQNRTNYAMVKSVLKLKFKEYNAHLVPMRLDELEIYDGFTPEQKATVHNLYESGSKEFDMLWDELKNINGGGRLRCPLCGVNFAKELDHYVPRELFPEYSANPLNIIPLCHDCNHDKGAKWKDENGVRMFFNAYFDDLSQHKLLQCKIMRIVNGLPLAEVSVCNITNAEETDKRVLKTIKELHLVDYYNDYVNRDLGTEVCQLQDDFHLNKAKYHSAQDFWKERRSTYASYLNHVDRYTEERLLLYEALTTSNVFDNWIVVNI